MGMALGMGRSVSGLSLRCVVLRRAVPLPCQVPPGRDRSPSRRGRPPKRGAGDKGHPVATALSPPTPSLRPHAEDADPAPAPRARLERRPGRRAVSLDRDDDRELDAAPSTMGESPPSYVWSSPSTATPTTWRTWSGTSRRCRPPWARRASPTCWPEQGSISAPARCAGC